MSTHDIQDSELQAVKDGLAKLGESIETIAKRELPKPEFQNNEISGDKIHGGTITEFSTLGIQDKSTSLQLVCLLYTSPSPRDRQKSRMPSSA